MEKLKNKIILLLHWSEKYTKTDMVYLVKGGSWLGLGQIVSTAAAFFTSVAFANLLPPETYGVYKYVLSITGILLVTTLLGMDLAVIQSTARGFGGTLITGVKKRMKWGTLGTIISLLIAGYYYFQGNTELALAFCIVSVFMPFSESFDMYNAFLTGKKLFGSQTRYNIVRKVVSLIAIVGTLFVTQNILVVLLVYFIALTIPAGFFLWQTVKKHLFNRKNDPKAVNYGKHLSVVYVIGLLLGELDKILVFHYLGAINLAVYALAVAPTDQIKGILKNVNALAMPRFSNRTPEEIRRTLWHKVLILALVITIMVLGYIFLAPIFFKIFFPKYLTSIPYSQILSISLIPAVLSSFIYTILEAQKDKAGIYKYNIYFNTFGIVILIPLIYFFGIWGAVISRIIGRFFSLGLSIILLKR
ncbi:MAG: oligosaccharide flippase family protein [Candidatus Zambryskibacteria bacterium]|nr:oligosaccharide flippase family protein [Candidatus Zambryskibacteria bacterium]